MTHSYLLWAVGKDQKGIVAAVSKVLYKLKCNLEDSAMMRLGSEFGIFLIFSSRRHWPISRLTTHFESITRQMGLTIQFKRMTKKDSKFHPLSKKAYLVSLHGPDRMGLVAHVTDVLAQHQFNITDLATHQTHGKKPGYIILIEGEVPSNSLINRLNKSLQKLRKKMAVKITLQPIPHKTF